MKGRGKDDTEPITNNLFTYNVGRGDRFENIDCEQKKLWEEIASQADDLIGNNKSTVTAIGRDGQWFNAHSTGAVSPKDYYDYFYSGEGGVDGWVDSTRENIDDDGTLPDSLYKSINSNTSRDGGINYLEAMRRMNEENVPPRAVDRQMDSAWKMFRKPITVSVHQGQHGNTRTGEYAVETTNGGAYNDSLPYLPGEFVGMPSALKDKSNIDIYPSLELPDSDKKNTMHHEMFHRLQEMLGHGANGSSVDYWSDMTEGDANVAGLRGFDKGENKGAAKNNKDLAKRAIQTASDKDSRSIKTLRELRGFSPEQIKFILERTP